ncbi:thiamine-phosphate kinase [Paenibacillus protaetiae]|uniref:Thiamine-monophosphate kinase n=1 Tax=Paenibacillus protaetiae TaxID=2509456 RepID=A0A4P6EYM3_9BACL|nr:thiamine-phosphate kinase [Paenibacillus protaetiae]QAY66889.1 thiamine-phosphate kinase [Paenibacillus protaetiae]
MDEFASIRLWTEGRQAKQWQQQRGVVLGIGDDAALLDPAVPIDGLTGPRQIVAAVDTMVETVHFNAATMMDEDIGYKALAANVSDIAAMGGIPLQALVSVSVPRSFGPERVRRLYDGLYACAERYGVAVAGGDTTSSPQHLVVAVTVLGAVEAGRALRRTGSRPGDAVFVTGPVGMSAAGLHALLAQPHAGEGAVPAAACGEAAAALVQAHRRPAPSVRAGRLLLERGTCTALNDVSDGLASEAWEIAEASGLRLVLRERDLPLAGSLAAYARDAGVQPLEWMLYGGEDYAMIGTAAAEDAKPLQELFRREGLPFFIIGETEAGEPGVELIAEASGWSGSKAVRRIPLAKRGYNHFA